jgi:hypothetical protein
MRAPRVDPAALRSVHVIAGREAIDAKTIFYDRERGALRPNLVFVDAEGTILFETNEAGLKGDPIDPQRKLAVVWGDSVVFSAGRGWPCLLDRLAPGYQFLNGGLEGDSYGNILRRAMEFNRRHPVMLNLLMLGWHPFVLSQTKSRTRSGKDNLRAELARFFEAVPNTVLLTVPTALNRRILDRDLSSHLTEGDDDTVFRFLGNIPCRPEWQRAGFEHVRERNALAREVCAGSGIRVVDLFDALDSENFDDFREHFVDVMHLRVRAHALVARIIHDGIKDLLD